MCNLVLHDTVIPNTFVERVHDSVVLDISPFLFFFAKKGVAAKFQSPITLQK